MKFVQTSDDQPVMASYMEIIPNNLWLQKCSLKIILVTD